MPVLTITRRLEIDAGHRLLAHEGKCKHLHGHRYAFEITVSAHTLDDVGRIIDFSVIRNKVGAWLDEHWDHGIILQVGDPAIGFCESEKLKYYELDKPPTAENLVAELAAVCKDIFFGESVQLESIRCWETPNCWADWINR